MTDTDMIGRLLIVAILEGDGPMSEATLKGTIVALAESKVRNGTAYLIETDRETEEAIRVYTPDPRFLLVDLEDLPPSRIAGMPDYIGGAFVRLYAREDYSPKKDASSFVKFLGSAELVEHEGQRRLSTARAAYVQAAAEVIEYARDSAGLQLALGSSSLREAAVVMSKFVPPSGYSADSLGRAKFLWGSFIGESILKDFGGRWFEDPKIGEVVLIPRGPLPPAKVSPFRVAERVLTKRDPEIILRWLQEVKNARASTEFLPPLVR